MPSRLYDRPIGAALAGALAISFSGILFRAAHVSPSTGAFYRCALALPVLLPLSLLEDRRFGPRPLRQRALAALAGVFFAIDLVAWHEGIEQVGAGLATVLGNLQVVFVGLLAWLILGERPSNRSLAAIPVALFGVLLISGVFESGAYGKNPGLGVAYGILTALAYSGFLLVLRAEQRRLAAPGRAALRRDARLGARHDPDRACDRRPRLDARLARVGLPAAARLELTGARLAADLDLAAAAAGRDHLRALDFQPVLTVLFAWAILDESPSPLQLGGVALVLSGLLIVTWGTGRADGGRAGLRGVTNRHSRRPRPPVV